MSEKNILSNNKLKFSVDWMKAKVIWFILSCILLGFSIFTIYHHKFNTNIDFNGGTLIEVGFKSNPDLPKLRQILKNNAFVNSNVQLFGNQEVLINTAMPKDNSDPNVIAEQIKLVLSKNYQDEISFRRVETVGPKIGNELIETSVIAVLVSVFAMLIYIWIRFELPFALGAIIALIHDIMITLGVLSFFNIEFGLPIVAALLTIVGYSMNDTVVIYDRIRENLIKFRKSDNKDIINLSVNEIFTRTLVTSGTTLIALISLLIFGGAILQPFILTMTIGVIVGTYSSIFVASPFLLFFNIKNNFKAPQKKSKKGEQSSSIGIL